MNEKQPCPEGTQPVTKEQIAAARTARLEEFQARLSALCDEMECMITPVPQIVDGRITATLQIKTRF